MTALVRSDEPFGNIEFDQSLDDEALLAEPGVADPAEEDITQLRHVASRDERGAAEEVANRAPCPDFDRVKPLFARAEADLRSGARETRPFGEDARRLR